MFILCIQGISWDHNRDADLKHKREITVQNIVGPFPKRTTETRTTKKYSIERAPWQNAPGHKFFNLGGSCAYTKFVLNN